MSLHVVVIGAGIVGASTALQLVRDGHQVTMVEPGEPGGGTAVRDVRRPFTLRTVLDDPRATAEPTPNGHAVTGTPRSLGA